MAITIHDVLTYPKKGRNEELLRVLGDLGIELIPFGKKEIFGVPVLGKGWSSIVILGILREKKVVVKIQRTDSNRISLGREASFLKIVNSHGIGPTLYHEGENFLVMEYVAGNPIREVSVERGHVLSFLDQCHRLDLLGIDHGQIQGGKHLLIGEKCWIIDFEKAGIRTPKNVSSLISELFLRTLKTQDIDPKKIKETLSDYKKNNNIRPVLRALNLQT